MKWEKVKLGDIATCIQPGPFGSQLHNSDYSDEGTPIIMPKDMIDGKISHNALIYVPEEHVQRLKRHQVVEGNLMVARKGDVRKCVYITSNENGWLTGSDCLKVALDTQLCNPKFIYYQLKSDYIGKWLETVSIGSTMPSLNTGLLSGIEMVLPPLPVQKRIASILSNYDNLIENNQKQIKLLEEAAQRLYREWFVDLRFPGHETVNVVDGVPEGWSKQSVGSLLGKIPKTKQVMTSDYLSFGKIPVIDQSRDFIAGYTNDTETLVDEKTPVIVFGDHTRILKYIQFSFAKGADGTQLIVSKVDEMPQSLLYCSLVNVDLSNYHYARHFKYLKAEEIIVPTKAIAVEFDRIVSVIMIQMQKLRDSVVLLQEARDRLLPKLMSGELEV
ncbi:MAG: restriction endonuclease subunit S [Oscillospiraceae bacterium]|nr:restriction endonuclease subunit S [Oscillospiraceae bacterium]